jgi:hypothetical protein
MSRPRHFFIAAIVGLFPGPIGVGAQQRFPQPRGSNVGLPTDWQDATIVAVGEVVHVRSYGTQTVSDLPYPAPPWVHELFWCVGDFHAKAVVKGSLDAAPQRYLYVSSPDCAMTNATQPDWGDEAKTRVFFLRVEGKFLRPVFDYGTHKYLGLLTGWDQGPHLPPRQRLGALLLTPHANTGTLKAYARYLWDVGDIACDLLGKADCARRIRQLAKLGDPLLRQNACGFLEGQLHEGCQ